MKSKTYIENSNWNGYWNICKSQMLMSSNVLFQFVNIALFSMVKEVFDWKVFDPFRLSADGFLGLGLFQHMFHNLLIYTLVVLLCFASLKLLRTGGLVKNLILMKAQSFLFCLLNLRRKRDYTEWTVRASSSKF